MPTESSVSKGSSGAAMSRLIGNERVLALLRRAGERGRLAHAYLFVGPEGVGKMTAAREFASLLLGETPLERHPDFFAVERGRDQKTGKLHGSIVLEQVHELCGRLALGALLGGSKVCILDGAHLLNKEAGNALLKNLEEPRDRTFLILLAVSEEGVAPTLRSRCQIMRFSRVPSARLAAALAERGTPPARAELFARLSGGCPGRALAYAEDAGAFESLDELRRSLIAMLGADVIGRLKSVDELLPPKHPFQESIERGRRALDLCAELLRDALLAAMGRPEAAMHVDVREETAALAAGLRRSRLTAALEGTFRAKKLLDENVNPRAVLEHFAVSF